MPGRIDNDGVEEFELDGKDQDVEIISDEDETPDDALDDDELDEDEDEETNDDDPEGDEPEGEDDEEDEFAGLTPRYTQFKAKNLKEYAEKLEEAYKNSSTEGVSKAREFQELQAKVGKILAAVEKSPELAKQLGLEEETVEQMKPKSAAEEYAEQKMNEEMDSHYSTFVEAHPEVETDEALRAELLAEVGAQAAAYRQRHGKIITMEAALNRAWKVLGYDDNSKEDLAVKAKDIAGQGKPKGGGSKPKQKESKVSDGALEIAKKMGLSEADVSKFYK